MLRTPKMKYIWTGLALGLSAYISPLTAACQGPLCEPYSPSYCQTGTGSCHQSQSCRQNDCYKPQQASCDVCENFLFGVEGLYWNVHEHNLDYAVDFDPTDDDEILGGKTHFLEYDWKGGARGYAGFVWNNWDIRAIYTWYENDESAKTDTSGSATTDLKASLLHPETTGEDAEIARAESDLTYKTIDLLVGRELSFCERSIVLHPFFGARAIQLNQKLQVKYQDGDFVDAPARVRWDSNLEAAGIHTGMDMHYRWCGNIGLYGAFAGSILASKTDIHHRQQTLNNNNLVTSTEIDLKEKQHVIVPGYQISTGFSWDGWCGSLFYYRIRMGYEFTQWFDTPLLRRYHSGNEGVSNSATAGHIGFHGATLSLDFKY